MKRGKTSSTKLNRNDPQGRRSSSLLLVLYPVIPASSGGSFARVRLLFLIDCFLSHIHSYVKVYATQKPLYYIWVSRNSNDNLFRWRKFYWIRYLPRFSLEIIVMPLTLLWYCVRVIPIIRLLPANIRGDVSFNSFHLSLLFLNLSLYMTKYLRTLNCSDG